MSVEDVAAALVGGEGLIDLTVALLRALRNEQKEYQAAVQLADADDRIDVARFRRALTDSLAEVQSYRLSSMDSRQLLACIERSGLPPRSRLLMLRAVAEALDNAFGEHIYHEIAAWYWPRRSGATRRIDGHWAPVGADDPIPLSSERRDRVRGPRRTVAGMSDGEQAPDRLAHMKLAPRHPSGPKMWIDFRISQDVAHAEVLTVGVGSPTGRQHFPWPPSADLPYEPLEPTLVARRQVDLTKAAGERGAQLVIFPELVLTRGTRQRILDGWLGLPRSRRPRLLLPGSEHTHATDSWTNSASLYCAADGGDGEFRRLPPYAHHKFKPVMRRTKPGGDVWPIEELAPQPMSIRLHVAHGLSVAVLICRDFIGSGVDTLVAELEPDILLVPAMTPRTDEMRGRAMALATGFGLVEVYLANAWAATAAPFCAHPNRDLPVVDLQPDVPGVSLVSLREQGVLEERVDVNE